VFVTQTRPWQPTPQEPGSLGAIWENATLQATFWIYIHTAQKHQSSVPLGMASQYFIFVLPIKQINLEA
jgi:hypothetical protein